MKRQQGFTLVEGILIVLVLGIIVAVGYLAYTNLVLTKDKSTSSVSAPADAKPVKIEKKEDLATASNELDNVSLDDTELSQLDSALNSF